MRNQSLNLVQRACARGLLSSALVLEACALPRIHRENAPEEAHRDAGTDTERLISAQKLSRDAGWDSGSALSDASVARDSGADSGPEAPTDPATDPRNQFEGAAAFRSLLPTDHNFAEWPMPDSSAAAPTKPNYTSTERIVRDNVTMLRWQRVVPDVFPGCKASYPLRNVLQAEGTGCTWEEARAFCSRPAIEEELGAGPWRLPTKIELESLLDVTRNNAIDPVFDTHPIDFFWSATPVLNPDGQKLAWAVDFSDGYPYASARYKGGRVRCVSSAQEKGGRAPEYSIDSNTVRDGQTQLVWQRFPDSEARTKPEAEQYCEKMDLDGTAWRLPYLKELLTIVDSTRKGPAIVPSAFPFTPSARFWTDSAAVFSEGETYQVDFAIGEVTYTSEMDEHFVRCVR